MACQDESCERCGVNHDADMLDAAIAFSKVLEVIKASGVQMRPGVMLYVIALQAATLSEFSEFDLSDIVKVMAAFANDPDEMRTLSSALLESGLISEGPVPAAPH
jgi:hypothetical protein